MGEDGDLEKDLNLNSEHDLNDNQINDTDRKNDEKRHVWMNRQIEDKKASDHMNEENSLVLERIKIYLKDENVDFLIKNHKPTFTSEESAEARNESIGIGGKAIVMKIDESYKLFVLSADRKIDSKKIKIQFNCKRMRFASTEELKTLTGLLPGSIPPFGIPILPLELNIDLSILNNEKIAFNAGSLVTSIIMNVEDYLRVAK